MNKNIFTLALLALATMQTLTAAERTPEQPAKRVQARSVLPVGIDWRQAVQFMQLVPAFLQRHCFNNANSIGLRGITPLHCAISNKNKNAVIGLILAGANVNHQGPDGKRPLHHARITCNVTIVNQLLTYGAY